MLAGICREHSSSSSFSLALLMLGASYRDYQLSSKRSMSSDADTNRKYFGFIPDLPTLWVDLGCSVTNGPSR